MSEKMKGGREKPKQVTRENNGVTQARGARSRRPTCIYVVWHTRCSVRWLCCAAAQSCPVVGASQRKSSHAMTSSPPGEPPSPARLPQRARGGVSMWNRGSRPKQASTNLVCLSFFQVVCWASGHHRLHLLAITLPYWECRNGRRVQIY